MRTLLRHMNWPLRIKMALLIVLVSSLPLVVAALIDLREARRLLLANMAALLDARSHELGGKLETFLRGYQLSASKHSRLPIVLEFCQADPAVRERSAAGLRATLEVSPTSDPNVRGVAILDPAGTVIAATEGPLLGMDLSRHPAMGEALRGMPGISDIFLAEPQVGAVPTIACFAPVLGPDQRSIATMVLFIRAAAVWEIAKPLAAAAGPAGSFVLFDHHGIRIADAGDMALVFHPAGELSTAEVDALVAGNRFGAGTRALLTDVRPYPEQFALARAEDPGAEVFRSRSPVDQSWSHAVANRLTTVPWTVFTVIQEDYLDARIDAMLRVKGLFTVFTIIITLGIGALFATALLRPIRALTRATVAIAAGDLAARVVGGGGDELGRLGDGFNAMALRIQGQAAALTKAGDDRELRVQERVAQLVKTTNELELEVEERRRAEEDMRTSQQLLRGIIESSDDAIISMGLDGVITSWNPGAEKLLGFTAQEVLGTTVPLLIPPERADEGVAILARIAQGENIDQFDTIRVQKGGRRIDISATISPIRDRDGRIIGASMIARDIRERKQGVTRLQEQLNRLDLLSQITRAIGERQDLPGLFEVVINSLEGNLPIDFGCACLYDPADHALTVVSIGPGSRVLATALGLAVKATIPIDRNGLSRCVAGALVYEPDTGEVRFPFPQKLAAGGLHALVAMPLLVENKAFGVLLVARRHAHSFSSGECEFLLQLSGQVALAAHQTQLHRSLQQAYDDLHQSQQTVIHQERLRALGQMASGIAHDINNAISPVLLYSETLLEQEGGLSPRTRKYLEIIKRSTEDVANTIARLGEFYRKDEAHLALVAVDLNELVPQVMDMTRARWSDMPQQRGFVIETVTELEAGLPAIMGIASEVREALINLVFNAVDAMPDGGVLTLRTRVAQASIGVGATVRQIQVEVQDSGQGMDGETRRRCLEPFFTTKGPRGTGLGLAMVYGVVRRHHADIEIITAVGKGTTMRVDFPLPTAVVQTARPVATRVSRANLRILAVDDDAILLKSLCESLERDGHTVVAESHGKAAIAIFRAAQERGEPFAVVITDLGMPHVDGSQVASAVKVMSPTTPVILLTGWGQRLIAEGEVPSYVDCVLSKPPKLNDLRTALATCCPPETPAPPGSTPSTKRQD